MNNFMQQPGVVFSDALIAGAQYDAPTAVPVFIGFTERGETGRLYAVASLDDVDAQLGGSDPAGRSILHHALRHYFDNDGVDCFVLCIDRYAALEGLDAVAIADMLANAQLLSAVAQEPAITLLSVPDIVLIDSAQSALWCQVWQALLQVRQARPDVFCLFDTPGAAAAAMQCRDQFSALDDHYGAAYWPHLVTDYRDAAGARIILPPSAAVAAIFQQTDRERGIWKAPANAPLAHVVKPQYGPEQSGLLFQQDAASINLIRSFPGRGVRVWGCRTMAANPLQSPWRYIQIRRLASYIETQLSDICRFFVFEPNNEITWIKCKGLSRAWLRKLWQSGGLLGGKEEEAFQILIGLNESMTEADLQTGKMIMKVAVALLQPAEFIELHLEFNTRESQVTSVIPTQLNRSAIA